jgi:hypothetical protein
MGERASVSPLSSGLVCGGLVAYQVRSRRAGTVTTDLGECTGLTRSGTNSSWRWHGGTPHSDEILLIEIARRKPTS